MEKNDEHVWIRISFAKFITCYVLIDTCEDKDYRCLLFLLCFCDGFTRDVHPPIAMNHGPWRGNTFLDKADYNTC